MSHMHYEDGAPPVRASDAERDEAAEVLRAAFSEGRLTRTELDERLTAAYAVYWIMTARRQPQPPGDQAFLSPAA